MTPPLSWHFLQDKNGRIQVIKSGKESDNGYVTSVQCCAKGDKTVLRIQFSDGKSKGFTVKGFNFTASRISRYFHTRGARSEEDVARVWSKYISPTLDPDTGIASTVFGDSDELDSQSSADQSLSSSFQSPPPSLNQTSPSQTTPCVTPSSNTRKRPLVEKTPNIRPIKVTKRALTTTPGSQASVQEKEKELDDAILRSFIGYYTLPISCLVEPHSDRLLRTAKDGRVEELKKAMKANPSINAAPIVGLVVLDEGESFDESKKETYLYETLGGNHSRAALQALCEELENPPAAFRTRLVSVYSGLSNEEAYRLASKHNNATSLQHSMSHWEKIQFCRNSLFKVINTPLTEPTPEKPKSWRGYCAGLLMDEVTALDDACVFFLASLPNEVFSLVEKVFQLYGKGMLKGQKVKRGSLGKVLELKGSNFKAMRGLDTQIAITVLQGVIKKEMSIQEMTVECREIKKLKEVQEMFVRETGVSSWREAEKEFPTFATPEALDEFKKCPVKSMPQRFKEFCQMALKSKVDAPSTSELLGRYSMGNSSAIMMQQHTSLDYGTVTDLCTSNGLNCNGLTLVTINIIQEEEIHQNLSVSIRCVKAINTTLGQMSFTTAVICKPFSITTVRTTLQDCGLEGIELGFVNMGEVDRVSPGCSLSESVVAIVVGRSGLCSDGTVRKSNLFDSEAHSLKDDGGEPFGPHDFQRGVYAELVKLYTSPSDWVLNLSIQSEEPTMGCLKANRSSLNTAEDQTLTLIKRRLNKELCNI